MKCHLCKENKLFKEFPFYPLTKHCNHPLLHCLDCATASVKKNKKCSQCPNRVEEDNEIYKEYLETLDFLFPPEEEIDKSVYHPECAAVGFGKIYVTTISGESVTLTYYAHKTIMDIKKEVEKELKTTPDKQRLIYQNKELKVRNEDRRMLTLKDHNVPPESKLHLIIVLWAVPDELDNAVFDFYWGLPPGRRYDYLDVSVLVYNGRSNVDVIYYRHPRSSLCPGVVHSGPADMDYYKDEGRHQVKVDLKAVPHYIDKLVFTLSAWRASSMSEYPYYRLNFYDVNHPKKQLCSDKVDARLQYNKSVIMCCLSRKNGKWEVIDMKKGSDGFTRNYSPLKRVTEALIGQGLL